MSAAVAFTVSLAEGEIPGELARHAPAARRVRVAFPRLRGDEALARSLEAHFARVPGIIEARADVASGRVLLRYAPEVVFSVELLHDGGMPSRPAAPPPTLRERLRRVTDGARDILRHRPAARRGAQTLPETAWHALEVDETLARLGTTPAGLARTEAAARIVRYGANALEQDHVRTRLEVVVDQVANLPNALLLGSAALSLALGDFLDAGAIIVVVAVNAGIGYRIERKNEQLLASWRRLEAGDVNLVRDGALAQVPAAELVPGDVVLLRAGDVVPADARVIDAHRLACDEAALTGESEPQIKLTEPMALASPLAERRSMLYTGSVVVAGRGRAVVVATGTATELARVRALIEGVGESETPLQRRLTALGRKTTLIGVGAAGVVAAVGLLRGRPLIRVLRSAVALGVAAIPEGLPVVATAALVNSMNRMRKNGMVVRRVASAETLGGVTVVCIDKTGTLTANEMQLEVLEVDGAPVSLERARAGDVFTDRPSLALAAAVLNSDVEYNHNGNGHAEVLGSATERALVSAAERVGLDPDKLRRTYPRRALHERRGGIHYVLTIHDGPDGRLAFLKGAPEQVLAMCSRDAAGPLSEARRAAILDRNRQLAADGHRVLAVAWQRIDEDVTEPPPAFDLVALAGLRDPVRPGAREAVQTAARAGIRTLILTGDQRATAAAVAREVGLAGEVVEGREIVPMLEAKDPAAIARLDRIAVVARVAPADKVAIVRALRARGEIVAMAGDGINDAPAIKTADVGVAVGAHASDIARQTADVVLENADLRSILAAVGEGRIVQDNLRRSVRFLFASNLSEVALMTIGAAVLPVEPLQPLQLLWMNLVTDTLPGLALALEPGDPAVLSRPPAPPNAPIISGRDWRRIVRDGVAIGVLGGAAFALGGSSAAFTALTASQLGYAFACRSDETRPQPRFIGLVGVAVALQLAAVALPPLRSLLRVVGVGVPLAALAGGLAAPLAATAIVRSRPIVHLIPTKGDCS